MREWRSGVQGGSAAVQLQALGAREATGTVPARSAAGGDDGRAGGDDGGGGGGDV